MGAGGVIQKHAEILLPPVSDPSVYDCLTDQEKDQVEVIRAKAYIDRTQDDVNFMLDKLNEHCRN